MSAKILLTVLVLLALFLVPSLAQNGMVNQNMMNNTTMMANQTMIANQTTTLSDQQKEVLMSTSQQFLSSYTSTNKYQISAQNLNTYVTQNNPNLFLLDVDSAATWNSVEHISGAVNIPIDSLVTRLNEIPADKMVVVVSNNSQDAAVAMTLLRMYGYNAYVSQGGSSATTSAGMTTTAGQAATGTTSVYSTSGTTMNNTLPVINVA